MVDLNGVKRGGIERQQGIESSEDGWVDVWQREVIVWDSQKNWHGMGRGLRLVVVDKQRLSLPSPGQHQPLLFSMPYTRPRTLYNLLPLGPI